MNGALEIVLEGREALPIVADIDNDGSAEIVVVSNQYINNPASPTVQVIRDIQDRWIQAPGSAYR